MPDKSNPPSQGHTHMVSPEIFKQIYDPGAGRGMHPVPDVLQDSEGDTGKHRQATTDGARSSDYRPKNVPMKTRARTPWPLAGCSL